MEAGRDRVFFGRERHDTFRQENGRPVGYPSRGVRTRKYLYIRNFRPDREPARDGEVPSDTDNGPTKAFLTEHRGDPQVLHLHQLAFGPRPAEELYDLETDPWQMRNIAGQARHSKEQRRLRRSLERWMREVGDPRAGPDGDIFDRYPVRTRPPVPAPSPRP